MSELQKTAQTPQYDLDVLRNAEKGQALMAIRNMALGALGIVSGLRSAKGLVDMVSRDAHQKKLRDRVKALQPAVLKVPYPVYEDSPMLQIPHPSFEGGLREERRLANQLGKYAQTHGSAILPPPPPPPPIVGKEPGGPGRGFGGWLAGDTHDSRWLMPWFPPVALVGTGAALYGGWKLTDWIADKLKKREEEQDLQSAREDYRLALLEPHMRRLGKTSAYEALDSLSDKFVEEANGMDKAALPNWLNNTLGGTTGGYLALATILAGLTGSLTYNIAAGKDPQKKIKEMLEDELVNRWSTHPPSVYAVPVTVRLARNKNKQLAMAGDTSLAELQNKVASFVSKHADELE